MSSVAQLEADFYDVLRPPPKLTLSQWADEKFYLSAESSAEPGRWHTHPTQRGWMDAMTDPGTTFVTVKKSSRIGYTKSINALVGFHIEHDPCPIGVVQPTIEDAKGYSKEEIAPMLRDVPSVGERVAPARAKNTDNTILQKLFKGGVLGIIGANSARGFRRVSRRVMIFDEIDGYPLSAGTEGDQITLGIKRTETYWDRKIVRGSTPTDEATSRIDAAYEAGDQRRYYVPCPFCKHMQVLRFEQFKWQDNDPSTVTYECEAEACRKRIPPEKKYDMLERGEWRAARAFAGHASFHIWAAYSYSANATWAHIVAEFLEAKGNVEKLKTFVNTTLGESWKDRGEAPDWKRLYDTRERWPIGTVPRGVIIITAGTDVQKDRLVYEVVGWGAGKQSWSIEAAVIPGDTSVLPGTDAAGKVSPWLKLNELLNRTFPGHDGGPALRITTLAVDSGYNTQVVYAWARTHMLSRVIAVKGQDAARALISSPTPVDVTLRGKKMRRGYKVWPVAPSIAKQELYGWLRLERPTSESREDFPQGFCHFPEHGEDFFKQLTAEHEVTIKNKKGFVRREWQVIPGRENHYLDCRVYARAAASVCGLDRMRTDTPPPPPTTPAPKPAERDTLISEAAQPSSGGRGGFLKSRGGRNGSRGGGWLKKR